MVLTFKCPDIAERWTALAIKGPLDDFNVNLLVGAGLLCLTPCLLYACWRKRPKTTVTFTLVWVTWYIIKLWQGDGAEIGKRFHAAGESTVILVIDLYNFVHDWIQLLLPFSKDLVKLLLPVGDALSRIWDQMDDSARLVTVVSFVAVIFVYICLRCLHKCVDKRKTAIKETGSAVKRRGANCIISSANAIIFVLCGPLFFMLGSHVPREWGGAILGIMMTILPLLFSLRALYKEQRAKDETREEVSLREKLRRLNGTTENAEENTTSALQERIRRWLAYWSVWPILSIAIFFSQFLIPVAADSDKKREYLESCADGVFLALVIWSTVWDLSKVVPVVTLVLDHFCGACCRRIGNRVNEKAQEAGKTVARKAMQNKHLVAEVAGMEGQTWKECVCNIVKRKWVFLAIAVIVVVVVGHAIGKTLEAVLKCATWIMLVAAGFETAFIVSQKDVPDMWHQRLAFWCIAALWMEILLTIPVIKHALSVWTPLVMVLSLLLGRTMLDLLLRCISKTLMCCLRSFLDLLECCCCGAGSQGASAEEQNGQNIAAGPNDQVAGTAAEPLLQADDTAASAAAPAEVAPGGPPPAGNPFSEKDVSSGR